MYCVVLALVATSAFLIPTASPSDRIWEAGVARQTIFVSPAIQPIVGRPANRRLADRTDTLVARQPLERVWIPLTCARSGHRMIC
jgi:hypothetical protein